MADAPEVRVCTNREETEAAYAHAQSTGVVYLAVERAEDTWGVVYDLLPAGRSFGSTEVDELRDTIIKTVEDRVEASASTEEVAHGIGRELGSLYGFENREEARRVAGTIAMVIGDD